MGLFELLVKLTWFQWTQAYWLDVWYNEKLLLLLGGELLAERCRTDDLMPSISLLCLPSCRVNPEIL